MKQIVQRILLSIFILFSMGSEVFSQTLTLDYFLQQAVEHSPLLKDYQNQALSLDQDSLIVRAGYKTHINANGVTIYAPTYNGYGYDVAITNGGTYSALLGLSP